MFVFTAAVVGAGTIGGVETGQGFFPYPRPDAGWAQPEINLGIIPGFGGTQRLPRLVGEARALELNLSGEPIGSDEAYALGLVNRVVPDHELLDTAPAWARTLGGQAPQSVGHINRISAAGELDAGIAAEMESFGSADGREGIAAFLAKRAPRWTGT
jgi:enoyl-CoA hydratase/3-hydroxyacyl-CoA dehydrogenase